MIELVLMQKMLVIMEGTFEAVLIEDEINFYDAALYLQKINDIAQRKLHQTEQSERIQICR